MIARLGNLFKRSSRVAGSGETDLSYPGIDDPFSVYIIGDIHGRIDLLRQLQDAIDRDCDASRKPGREIYLGDYVDRGRDSAAVLDALIARGKTRSVVCLAGNHEQVFLEATVGEIAVSEWFKYGGRETVLSYGLNPNEISTSSPDELAHRLASVVPDEHLEFMRALELWYRIGDYVVVHAGIRPGIAMEQQERKDLLWIRDGFLKFKKSHGFIVVHGHTPVGSPEFLSNRINLDTGAYLSNRLTCLKISHSGVGVLNQA